MQYKETPGKKKSFGYAWVAAGLLLLLIGGWIGWREWQFHQWNELVENLREQPGLGGRVSGPRARQIRDPRNA